VFSIAITTTSGRAGELEGPASGRGAIPEAMAPAIAAVDGIAAAGPCVHAPTNIASSAARAAVPIAPEDHIGGTGSRGVRHDRTTREERIAPLLSA